MMGDGFGYSSMGYNANGIFWVLLIILIVWLYSVLVSKTGAPKEKENKKPVEILEKRLSEGEIDVEEFNHRLSNMSKDEQK